MEDQRSEPRIVRQLCFSVQVYQCQDNPKLVGASLECEAIDFSMHGMQFSTNQVLPRQTLLNISVGFGSADATFVLQGEVCWTRKSGSTWYVGVLLDEEESTDYRAWADNFAATFAP